MDRISQVVSEMAGQPVLVRENGDVYVQQSPPSYSSAQLAARAPAPPTQNNGLAPASTYRMQYEILERAIQDMEKQTNVRYILKEVQQLQRMVDTLKSRYRKALKSEESNNSSTSTTTVEELDLTRPDHYWTYVTQLNVELHRYEGKLGEVTVGSVEHNRLLQDSARLKERMLWAERVYRDAVTGKQPKETSTVSFDEATIVPLPSREEHLAQLMEQSDTLQRTIEKAEREMTDQLLYNHEEQDVKQADASMSSATNESTVGNSHQVWMRAQEKLEQRLSALRMQQCQLQSEVNRLLEEPTASSTSSNTSADCSIGITTASSPRTSRSRITTLRELEQEQAALWKRRAQLPHVDQCSESQLQEHHQINTKLHRVKTRLELFSSSSSTASIA